MTRKEASRFLTQATFGPTLDSIAELQETGFEAWIDAQMTMEPTLQTPYIWEILRDFYGEKKLRNYSKDDNNNFIHGVNARTPFLYGAVEGEDQLRQRVAYAYSQIFVISRSEAQLENRPLSVCSYYDMLAENAFGTYFDLLMDVTRSAQMGVFLSHVGNQKTDESRNIFPDENYAREVMQLFSIGLWELNMDGTQKLDSSGAPIPTYDNVDIAEMARVLTGFWYGGRPFGDGGWQDQDLIPLMDMNPDYHDYTAKTMVSGHVIPARNPTVENGLRDVEDAIRVLSEHPNTAPFISKQMIGFLVTSNPSPAYVERIANVFVDNGAGVRGDMGAVVRAILLDEEARDPKYLFNEDSDAYGLVREPVVRLMHFFRAFGINRQNYPNLTWWDWGTVRSHLAQEPMHSPSVFNFYPPNYIPPSLTEAQLKAPVMKIINSYSAISYPNFLWSKINNGVYSYQNYYYLPKFEYLFDYLDDTGRLVDHLALIFCQGNLSKESRTIIIDALDNTHLDTRAIDKVRLAVYFILLSPDATVQQ